MILKKKGQNHLIKMENLWDDEVTDIDFIPKMFKNLIVESVLNEF